MQYIRISKAVVAVDVNEALESIIIILVVNFRKRIHRLHFGAAELASATSVVRHAGLRDPIHVRHACKIYIYHNLENFQRYKIFGWLCASEICLFKKIYTY